MKLNTQKRLAAQILKCSPKRVIFDQASLEDIKESITKADIRGLINDGVITRKQKKGISRGRARKRAIQKRKGRQQGPGSRKGKKTSRLPRKRLWMNTIRSQRDLIRRLKQKGVISKQSYRELYLKCKGGFFRSRRHIKLYLQEHGLK